MKKLSVKNIVEFRNKSDRGKKNFANALKSEKVKSDAEGGGDYWVTSLSAIANSFKLNGVKPIVEKIAELKEKLEETGYERTKAMYKRNIDILRSYEDFDLKKWRPAKKVEILKKSVNNSILTIKGFQVQVLPHHVFTITKPEVNDVGAIWFVAKLHGFKKEELAMFSDILFRYLKAHYYKKYNINSKYCIAVDVVNNIEINYAQIENEDLPKLLNPTLDEIGKLL